LRSLQARLVLSYAVVIILALTIAAVSLYGLAARRNLQDSMTELLEQARTLAAFAARNPRAFSVVGGDDARTPALLRLAGAVTDARIVLVGSDGRTVAEVPTGGQALPPALSRLAQEALRSRRPTSRQLRLARDQTLLAAAVPLAVAAGDAPVPAVAENLTLVLVRTEAGVRAGAAWIVRPLLVAGVLAGGAALALGFGLARGVALPVRRMGRAARKLAAGDFSARVGGPRAAGELGELAGAFDDMAARLGHLVKELARDKELLEAMVTGLGHGLVAVDRAGKIIHRNPRAADYIGAGSPQAGGISPALDERLIELAGQAGRDRRPAATELETGGRLLQAVATPLAEGGAIIVLQDVTSTRQLDRMRRDFVASVSHELRTPVTAIQGFLDAIREGVARDPDQQARCLTVIGEETARLRRLIDDLFDYAKLESGQTSFRFEPLDLVPVLRHALGSVAPLAAQGRIVLAAELPATLPPVIGDRDRITQVVTNLLTNALRFTGEEGRVTLRAWQEGGVCQVEVADNGRGIPPEQLERIFDQFYSGPDRATRRSGGAGLGLAIARHLVEAHGGRIWARSDPSQGSVFTFTLPLASPSSSPVR
jgi:signal transduction histidine kinase